MPSHMLQNLIIVSILCCESEHPHYTDELSDTETFK